MSNLNMLEKREQQKKTSYKVKKTFYIILSTLVITALLYIIGMYGGDSGEERPIEYKVIEDVIGFEINSVEFTSNSVGNLDEDIYPVIYLSEKKMVYDIITKRDKENEVEDGESDTEVTEEVEGEEEIEEGIEPQEGVEEGNAITTVDSETEGYEEGVITSTLPVVGLEFDKETGQYLLETVNIGDMQVEVRVGFSLYKDLDTTTLIEEMESVEQPITETEGEGLEDNPFGEEEPVDNSEDVEEESVDSSATEEESEGEEVTTEGGDSLDNLFEDLEEDSAE